MKIQGSDELEGARLNEGFLGYTEMVGSNPRRLKPNLPRVANGIANIFLGIIFGMIARCDTINMNGTLSTPRDPDIHL
jgi:hypothetical protein